jgi:hypothetical protein
MSRKLFILAAVAAFANVAAAAPSEDKAQGAPEAQPKTDLSHKNGTLSEKLKQNNGVIHPEGAVDPKMEKEAPDTGTMPVIPPGGSNGGAQAK